jgi:predicted DCC family thiol-disulfide oxidoreductase YuxK
VAFDVDPGSDLPLDSLPDGLIVFDGVCVLCSAWVAFIVARDRDGVFRFMPMQSPLGRAVSRRLGIDADKPDTFVLIRRGEALTKSDGALAILAALPGWGWARLLRLVPKPIRDWAYDRVARNRYRIFGRRSTCLVPDASIAHRFVGGEARLGNSD